MEPDMKYSTISKLKDKVKLIDPQKLSRNSGAAFHDTEERGEEFRLAFFGESITITHSDFIMRHTESGEEVQEHIQTLILYYFVTADGTTPAGRWVALSELPDGGFYNQAYQGYSGNRLVKAFGNNTDAFRNSARATGGKPESYGDCGFKFQAFPNLPLLAVYWKGDEEFSPSAKVLFDSSACHYLPTDLCAFLGSILTNKLIEAK
jgi:hypothetical protein